MPLLEQSPVVGVAHLLAALALWDYSYRSTEAVFGDSLGDATADDILRGLRGRELTGMTRTEISGLFSGHRSKGEIGRALNFLLARGLADYEVEQTDGRSVAFFAYFAPRIGGRDVPPLLGRSCSGEAHHRARVRRAQPAEPFPPRGAIGERAGMNEHLALHFPVELIDAIAAETARRIGGQDAPASRKPLGL